MNRRKTGFLRLFALVITAMTVMTGCKNETSAVMKDRKSTRLNSSHANESRMPSSA